MRQALYRTYRPKTFDEVVGQEHITRVLKNEMAAGHPAHAYLFVGPRGTGKTSCAKLVAKAANCLHLQGGNPCGACGVCRGVDDATLLDVLEIDAASNNGVDNIRELRDEAVFTPATARYRVYIIDEVHMLSASAMNALLKILEEPPEHVLFILATTEIHKVLPTVVSRCQRFDFGRIETPVIARRLLDVAAQEEIALTGEAAALIGRLSQGGMRDALSLLDVCAANAEAVTEETVARAAGLTGTEHLFLLSRRLLDGDSSGALEAAGELLDRGADSLRLCEQLIGHFRNLMLSRVMKHPEGAVDAAPAELEQLAQQAQTAALSDLTFALETLQAAAARMGKSPVRRAELELALVALSDSGVRGGQQTLLARIERLEAALRQQKSAAPPAEGRAPRESARENPATADPPNDAPPEEAKPAAAEQQTDGITPFAQWPLVLERLGAENPSMAGLWGGTRAFFDGRRVLIDVQNPALLTLLKTNDYTRDCIKRAVASATGKNWGIGPYRAEREEAAPAQDPLEQLIAALPEADGYIVK